MKRIEDRTQRNAALKLDPSRTAVLAVDVHRGHLDPEIATMPVAAEIASEVVDATESLLDTTRAAGIPTIFVVMENRIVAGESEYLSNPFWKAVEEARHSLNPDLPSTVKEHNLVGSPQTEIMPTLGPKEGDYVVVKHRLSSFVDTDLSSLLRTLGVDTLLLTGINTNTCVQSAAFDGFNRDFAVVMVSDCVDTMYGSDLHSFGLENVARCLGWVLSGDEVAEKISRR